MLWPGCPLTLPHPSPLLIPLPPPHPHIGGLEPQVASVPLLGGGGGGGAGRGRGGGADSQGADNALSSPTSGRKNLAFPCCPTHSWPFRNNLDIPLLSLSSPTLFLRASLPLFLAWLNLGLHLGWLGPFPLVAGNKPNTSIANFVFCSNTLL